MFAQQYWRSVKFSEMLNCVYWDIVTDVSKDYTDVIFIA